MAYDDRDGRPNSGTGTVASGDGDTTLTTVMQTRDDAPFVPDSVRVIYRGSATTEVTLHDDPDGTNAADLSDARVTLRFTGGDTGRVIDLEGERDWVDDVIADPDGSQDGDITIEMRGHDHTPTVE